MSADGTEQRAEPGLLTELPGVSSQSKRPGGGGGLWSWSTVSAPAVALTAYFRDLQAAGRSAAILRLYGMHLLR
jgi:hypothetical protein